jgi:hypothetical protein
MYSNTPPLFAQNIQTGNASAQSTVQTDVQGSGSVSTHIEINANGVKKVLDSNSPGTYKLEVQSNGNSSSENNNDNQTITPTVSLSPTPTIAPTATPTPPIIVKTRENHNSSFLSNIAQDIQNFFDKIFSSFKPK